MQEENVRALGKNIKGGNVVKRLHRCMGNKIFGGVCSGIGEYFGIDPTIVRLVAALLSLGSLGTGIIIYIIFWCIMPPDTVI